MAFRNKADRILTLNPDILIVQECEAPNKIQFDLHSKKPAGKIWKGDNTNKGVAVYSYSEFHVKLYERYDPQFKYVIPIKVSKNDINFTIIAVWLKPNETERDKRYIGQLFYAINYYKELLDDKIIIMGDFNWNKIWDVDKKTANLSSLTDLLSKTGIKSVYHEYFKEDFGNESLKTLALRKNRETTFHIDYCFAGSYWLKKIKKVELGNFDDWISVSDHVPLFINFDL